MKKKVNIGINIKGFIIAWNERYPYDKYIRKKYGIAFGSPEHRKLNFIDMAIEYKEDKVLQSEFEKFADEKERKNWGNILPTDVAGTLQNKEIVKLSQRELDAEFDKLDLRQFDDKPEQ
jgi:hypothetical protein